MFAEASSPKQKQPSTCSQCLIEGLLFHGQETMAEQLVLPRSGDRGDMVGHVAGVPKVYVAGVHTVRP
jgi:hypothetical protein